MTLKDELKDYQERWAAVEAIQSEERRTAPLELRWKQLNAAYAIAKSLGLLQPDVSEVRVYEQWAKLKEKAANRRQRV